MILKVLVRIGVAVRSLVRTACPHGKDEKAILFLSLAYFLSFSMIFACNVDVSLQPQIMGYDTFAYIDGENPKLVLSKALAWNVRHPLFVLFNLPALLVAAILAGGAKWCVFALFSSLIMSLSNLLIYKICRFYEVSKYVACCAVLLFSSFAHVILLAGQAETFVYTMFFSLLAILVVLRSEDDKWKDNVLFMLLAGTTITNAAKFFMLKLCKHRVNIKKAFIETWRSAYLFLTLGAFTVLGLLYRIFIKHLPLREAVMGDTINYIRDVPDRLLLIWENFFCEPLLFHSQQGVVYTTDTTMLGDYPETAFGIVILCLYVLCVMSLFVHRKTYIAQVCLAFLSVDFLIHFIIGYGKNELQLFCLHWLFFLPVLLALLIKSSKRTLRRFSCGILFLLALCFMAYNAFCYFNSIFAGSTYGKQLQCLRERGTVVDVTNDTLFFFGMGNRTKLMFKLKGNDGILEDLTHGKELFHYNGVRKVKIEPSNYRTSMELADGKKCDVFENEIGVFRRIDKTVSIIDGTHAMVKLPTFNSNPFGKVLRVLLHDVLFNVENGKVYPNIFVYDKPWLRDAAMAGMVLEKTGNTQLVENWVQGMDTLYDLQNGGAREMDNLGEFLYLKSLFPVTKNDKSIDKVCSEIKRHVVCRNGKTYIAGLVDFQPNDQYITTFASVGMDKVGVKHHLTEAMDKGVYDDLLWFSDSVSHNRSIVRIIKDWKIARSGVYDFPYLDWARGHYYDTWNLPFSNSNLILSWEANATSANYEGMRRISTASADKKVAFPHTWTAAEMFLRLYDVR